MTGQPPAGGASLGDARFFLRAGPFSLGEIAQHIGARIAGGGDAARFVGVAPLQTAGPGEISFLHNTRYVHELEQTRAGAVILSEALLPRLPAGAQALVVGDPHLAWARTASLFHPLPPLVPGIHPSAVVEPGAKVDPSAEIGPLAVIGAGAEVGPRCRIGPHATIGAGVILGADCRIGPNASVSHAILGARVYLYPGARVGQEGFGFAITKTGFVTVPQLGRVILGDDVEIGANTCVDRGGAQDTIIGAGTRLDNLVQVGHGVQFGLCCVVAAQAGISGSTVLGDFVQVAAQSGFTGHIRIGSRARIGAQAGVMNDVPEGQDVLGSPAMPKRLAMIGFALVKRMAEGNRTRARERAAGDAGTTG